MTLRSDEIFRRLVDSVHDYAIFMLDTQGVIASWNRGAQRIKGYTAEEAIGRHFSIFYPPEAVASGWPEEELRRSQAQGRFEDEGWRLRKDGSRFWANVVISPLRDDAGKLLGYSKVTRDLTERRRHEQELAESERSLRLLIEGVQDYAIFRLDPRGIITSWNLGAERIKGYTAEEAIGRSFELFYRPEAVASGWPQEELRRATALGRFEDEGWRVRKDGSLLWANVVITAIRSEHGELIGFSKVTRDLTERRRHEQALRDSEDQLRLIVEGVKDHAMFLIDDEGRVRSWNAAAHRLLGYAGHEILGQDVGQLYPPEDRSAGRPAAEIASARHAGFFETEGWRLQAGGERLWTAATLTALHAPDGSTRGFVQIVRDLTQRRRVEALESEGRRIQEFIAMLSHELRNPLAPIHNAVAVLRRTPDDLDVVGRCTDMIGRQAGHLSRMVDDLLDVSRITNGKIELQREPLELNTLARMAADAMRPTLASRGHEFAVTPAGEPLFVEGDPVRLTQAITNLLTNANKYTPPQGRIALRLERRQDAASLAVIDNGIGMSEALMQHAFEPFVQGERALDRSGGGLGIGLTLVKRIVELHGGSVAVASSGPGSGTRFELTLPLSTQRAPAALAPAAPARAHEPVPRGPILVVDDNRDAADSLAMVLRLSGHDVRVAHDGETALRLAAERAPRAVLLDIGLPGLDGFEVARRLRALPGLQHTLLIAATGYGQAADRNATAQAGFDAHLVKPVDHEALGRLID